MGGPVSRNAFTQLVACSKMGVKECEWIQAQFFIDVKLLANKALGEILVVGEEIVIFNYFFCVSTQTRSGNGRREKGEARVEQKLRYVYRYRKVWKEHRHQYLVEVQHCRDDVVQPD